jgi:hypothetical protein
MSGYNFYRYITTPSDPDIELEVLVVGEQRIWAYARIDCKGFRSIGGLDLYNVPLSPSEIDKGNNRGSKRSLWGVRKWEKDEESECWYKVRFYTRTLHVFYTPTQGRYNRGNFGVVAIFYAPHSPRQTFELMWTKACAGGLPILIVPKNWSQINILWRGCCAQWLAEIISTRIIQRPWFRQLPTQTKTY